MFHKDFERIMDVISPNDKTAIPIANVENKRLMEEIERLTYRKERQSFAQNQIRAKLDNLKETYVDAEHDINQNSKLIEAHQNQLADECLMYNIAQNTVTSVRKKLVTLRQRNDQFHDYYESTKDEIKKKNTNIKLIGKNVKWMTDVLHEWLEAMKKSGETNDLIQKFCKEDEFKANSLENKRRLANTNIAKKRKLLENSYSEQVSLENIIQKTSQHYREAHAERKHLVNNWKEAVTAMTERNNEIKLLTDAIDHAHDITEIKNRELKEQMDFFQQQLQNNKETEKIIAELNERFSQQKNRLTHLTETILLNTNEFITLKKTIENVSVRLQQQRQKNRQTDKSLREKSLTAEKLQTLLANGKKKLERFKEKMPSIQDRMNQMQILVQDEENNVTEIATNTSRLSGVMYRSEQMLLNLKNQCTVQKVEIDGIHSEIGTLKNAQIAEGRELANQTNASYKVDFTIVDLKSRLAVTRGSNSEIALVNRSQIAFLEELLDDAKRKQQSIRQQINRIEFNMRTLNASYGQSVDLLLTLENKLKEQQLCCDGGKIKLSQLTLCYQEHLVEHSMTKMRTEQIAQMLTRQKHKSYSMQKYMADIELEVNERMMNIEMQKKHLLMERKLILDEIGQLHADIGERTIRIEALICRFQNAVENLGKNEDGTVITATQIKIQTAQEKQILMVTGNELNEKVVMAEKDIKSVEKMLVVLNGANGLYKKTLNYLDGESQESELLSDLQLQHTSLHSQLKNEKALLAYEMKCVNNLENQLDEIDLSFDIISKLKYEKNDNLIKIHKEILDQKCKMDRAQTELKRSKKSIKPFADRDFIFAFASDIKAKEFEERNLSALQKLADIIDGVMEMGPVVTKYLCEKGLSIPQSASRVMSHTTSFRTDRTTQESDVSLKIESYGSVRVNL